MGNNFVIPESAYLNHTLLMGTTRVGKSKAIEWFARESVKKGHSVVILDSSDSGRMAYDFINWCATENVEADIIDVSLPKVATINPFVDNRAIDRIRDTFMHIFGVKDISETPIVSNFMTSFLNILKEAGHPLADARYFSRFDNPLFEERKAVILDKCDPNGEFVIDIQRHQTKVMLQELMGSTARRFFAFLEDNLPLIFSTKEGINFNMLVSRPSVLVVNLYPMPLIQGKFLGTMILHEVIGAVDRIKKKSPDFFHPVTIYIDEAARFMTRQLGDILAYRQKSGIFLTLAFQSLAQIEDEYLRGSVLQLCKNKVMFQTPDFETRGFMLKQLNMPDTPLVTQEALAKFNNENTVKIKIPDIKDAPLNHNYIGRILDKYKTKNEIKKEIEMRFNDYSGENKNSSERGASHDSGANQSGNKSKTQHSKYNTAKVGNGSKKVLSRNTKWQDIFVGVKESSPFEETNTEHLEA